MRLLCGSRRITIIMGVAKRLFYSIGRFSASHPLMIIAAAVVCVAVCCIGFKDLVVTVRTM